MKPNLTHLSKVYWPIEGYTKGDLLAYYDRIAPRILPFLKDRPTALNRFPNGVTGTHFFQKNMRGKLPPFVRTVTIRAASTGKPVRYVMCNNKETLLWLANLGAIELHPWNSRTGSLSRPDHIVFDLDPGPRSSFNDVVRTALALRKALAARTLSSYVKTSGKRGLHLYVPTKQKHTYLSARRLATQVAKEVVSSLPDIASLAHWPKDRRDKVYIDISRNATGQTVVAPYSVRPVPGAPVATPLAWSEVRPGLDPRSFTIRTVFKRLKRNPWKGFPS